MVNWFKEIENGEIEYGYAFQNKLFEDQSKFQDIKVIDTLAYGKMLILDDFVMLTESDEFVYHELIAHIPVCFHKNPEKVVVIGGGDGGTVRELVKHDCVKEVVLCEIDGMVVDVCKKFFPAVAGRLDHPKVDVKVGDGMDYVRGLENEVDLMIIDSTDPVGPGEGLFTGEFYQSVSKALKPDGMMAAQSESPWAEAEFLNRIHNNIRTGFDYVRPYIASVPTYPRGLWSWTLGSHSPIDVDQFDYERFAKVEPELNYLSDAMVRACFELPKFYRKKLSVLNQ